MKRTAGAFFALGVLAALPAHAQTHAEPSAGDKLDYSAVVKADWDDWHGRWNHRDYRWHRRRRDDDRWWR